jgi:hypothetical protein
VSITERGIAFGSWFRRIAVGHPGAGGLQRRDEGGIDEVAARNLAGHDLAP